MYRSLTKNPRTSRVFGASLLSFMTLIGLITTVGFVAAFAAGGETSYPTKAGSPHSITAIDNVGAAFNASTSDVGAYELQVDTVIQSGIPSFIVNTPDDHDDGACTDGDCTLREAIIAANSNSDTSTITFDLPGAGPHVIQLTKRLDDLATNMNIQGPTDESVEVRGESVDDPYSIFTVSGAEVSISQLTISNGAEFGFFGGGGILNLGFLTINNCTFTGNLAEFGGAIDNEGILTINNSTFTVNEAGVGGAVYNFGVLNVENSTFTANHAIGEGGAIDTEAGLLIIVNSTISGNSSDGDGGGLLHCGDTTGVLTNVTITNNRADADGDAVGVGGGISQVSSKPITLRNTIVANNFKGKSPSTTPDDIDGTMDPSSSYNLIGVGGSGGLVNRSADPAHGNQVGVANPMLGPLQNNGGSTFTHALLVGSPAFNAAIDMTSLNGNIDAVQTSFDVVDASGIPNCVDFTIRIDDEQMVVKCSSGNTLDVTRGANGTTATAHSTGADVNPPFDQRGTGFRRVAFTISDTSLDIGAFEVQQATPHHLAFNVQPSNTNVGATITPAVTVRILDAENNATTSTANVTLSIGTNPGGGTLSGTTTVAAVNGTATFSNLSIDKIGNGYTLTASSAGLIGTSSNPFNIISPASISGTKTVSGVFTPGSTVTYTVVISNGGPATQLDNPGPEFTDVLPSSLTLVSANATSGTATATIGTNTVNWNGSIAVSGSVTITITATIHNLPDGTTVSNQGTISYDADGNGTNESTRLTDDPTIAGPSNPTNFNVNDVNHPPDAVDDVLSSVAEDSGVRTIPIASLLANDTKGPANESGQTLTLTAVGNPVGGTVSNDATNVYFTPAANFNGAASFQYTITDNGTTNGAPDPKSDTATVSFTIWEVNDAPTAVNDALSAVAEDSGQRTIQFSTLLSNDSKGPANESGQTLIVKTVSNPVGGTVSIVAGTVRFTPAANFNGTATFKYTVEDNGTTNGVADPKTSAPAFVHFVITEVNDAPTAVGDTLSSVAEDSGPRTIPFATLTGNDSTGPANESGQTLIVKTVSNPVGGTVSIVGGNVLFTPTADFNGAASFDYTVEDNGTTNGVADPKTSAAATVSFTITEVNDAPTAINDTLSSIAEDSGPRTIPFADLTGNDSKGPANESGQTLTVKTVSNAVGGTVSIVGGNVLFTPTANFYGAASFQYTVEDNGTTNGVADPKTSAPATVSFTITPVADTPSVTNATTNANTQTTSGLVISRNPADGAEVTHFKITNITGGTLFKNNGTTVINNGDFITFAEGNAGLKFTPGTTNGSFMVQASLSASDAGLGSLSGGTATATITINALGGVIRFSAANYSVAEGAGFKTITVERSGDTSQPVRVDYASTDHSNPADFIPCTAAGAGFASSRCDFTTAVGTLRFAAGETSKTFNVLISQDNYVEGTETLELTLSNLTGGAVFGVPQTAILSILDDATEPATNPIDTSSDFVRSQYHDFLHREPDGPGLAFWTDNIEKCNDPARRPAGQTVAQCIDKQRESTAIAFFMSPEFQMTGGFVYRLYKGSLTGVPNYDGGSAGRFPTFLEFMYDLSQVSEGIVVNNQLSGAVVEANRNRLAAEFVQRPEFLAKYGGLNNTLYVQELFNTTGIAATASEKQTLVNGLTNGTDTRAGVLRKVVDGTVVINNVQFTTTYGQAFYNQENRRVFVFMEYVGYLRRNPDTAGFVYWLGKLNQFNGDPFQAEMVRSFILSPEYRSRFGQL